MMKSKFRIASLAVSLLLLCNALCTPAAAASPYELPSDVTINAPSVLLMALGSTKNEDTALFEREADSKRSPAALVRIMVGVTAIEIIREKGLDLDTAQGVYTAECFNSIAGTGLSVANMSLGETWTLRDLLSISTIQTAADACVTLAVTLSGSQAAFVERMNTLAQTIGCDNTLFSNVTGIDSVTQYTSARDTYRILRYAMDYPEFEPLLSNTQYTIKPVSGGKERTMVNTNDMIRPTSTQYYTPVAFGKTGYTDQAGRCLVTVARYSGYEYLSVVLGSPVTDASGSTATHFKDTKALLRWALNNFTYKTLVSKNEPITQLHVRLSWSHDTVTLVPAAAFASTVPNDLQPETIIKKVTLTNKAVDAPVAKGQVCGKLELFINVDQKIGEVNLIASESVERSEVLAAWSKLQSFLSSPLFYVGLALLVLLLIGYIILNIVHNRRRRRKRMKRVKKFR